MKISKIFIIVFIFLLIFQASSDAAFWNKDNSLGNKIKIEEYPEYTLKETPTIDETGEYTLKEYYNYNEIVDLYKNNIISEKTFLIALDLYLKGEIVK